MIWKNSFTEYTMIHSSLVLNSLQKQALLMVISTLTL